MASPSTQRDIPLRRLSTTSSRHQKYTPSLQTTTSTLPPSYTSSLYSTQTSSTLLPTASQPFHPTTCLQIQASGKHPISFPFSVGELTIPIFSLTTNPDGQLVTTRPRYLSIRPQRRSGSCYLVDAEDEAQTPLVETEYFFGPGRNPIITVGENEFKLEGKNMVSRTVKFESEKWGRFEWRYAGGKERGREVDNLLVLEKVLGGKKKEREVRIRVAQMVRSEDTRSPGSKKSSAGNGGRLEMCLSRDIESGAASGDVKTGGGAEEVLIDEVTVVATCLCMLKKEVDRMRTLQIVVMSGAAGGGS